MSDNSSETNSGSSFKSIKDRLQNKGLQTDIKKGFSQFTGRTKNLGTKVQSMLTSTKESSNYSKGVREFDEFGFEKYNLEDETEIFISRVPDKAFFNDGEPIMVRANGGQFIGSSDRTAAKIEITDSDFIQEDSVAIFTNVPHGTAVEKEFRATVGKVNAEGGIDPAPIDNSFLDKMKSVSGQNSRAQHRIEFMEEAIEETPAEVMSSVGTETPMPRVPDEFEAEEDDEDAPLILSGEQEINSFLIEDEPVEAEDVCSDIGESPELTASALDCDGEEACIEISGSEDCSLEADVCEAPSEEPIEEEIEIFEEFMPETEEVVCEDVIGIPVINLTEEQLALESCIREVSEKAVAEAVADAQAPVPAEPMAVMSLPTIEIPETEEVAGLVTEGNEASSESEVSEIQANVEIHETAATSSAVAEKVMIKGIDASGEGLPELKDPVITRPRSVRFRFSNGVLQNVDSEKVEPREDLRDPLA